MNLVYSGTGANGKHGRAEETKWLKSLHKYNTFVWKVTTALRQLNSVPLKLQICSKGKAPVSEESQSLLALLNYNEKKIKMLLFWLGDKINNYFEQVLFFVCMWGHHFLKSKTKEPPKILSSSSIREGT